MHYLRRDFDAEYVHQFMAEGKHVYVLYEPNDFCTDWRLVEFELVSRHHPRRDEMDRMFVVLAEWEFEDDPRVKQEDYDLIYPVIA